MATAAEKKAAAAESLVATLEAEGAETYREPGPSSGQTFFLVELLARELELHDPKYNEELRGFLRTRRGASALIGNLKRKHNIPDKPR